MSLTKSAGNMYEFVTHTWNTIKGKCLHDCSYCYVKRHEVKELRFDEKELNTQLGTDNFIFIGSGCDMFAKNIPEEWILKTLKVCEKFDSKYLFQTKNPARFLDYLDACVITDKSVLCTTIESNRWYPDIMRNSPSIKDRVHAMKEISEIVDTYITIEPILDFDLDELVHIIHLCEPKQVNIGADSGNCNLPEPTKQQVLELISELEKFTIVNQKPNLKRILINKSMNEVELIREVLRAKKYQKLKERQSQKDIEHLIDVVTITHPEINSDLVINTINDWIDD